MSAKAKGTRLEHKTMKRLRDLGYACTRAAASLGAFDIIASSRSDIRYIQSKANRWAGSVEVEAMELFPVPPTVRREVWRWDDHARQPRVRELVHGQGWKERVGA